MKTGEKKNQAGVTMAEIIGVLAVILVVSGMLLRGFNKSNSFGKEMQFTGQISTIEKKLWDYKNFYKENVKVTNTDLFKAGILTEKECRSNIGCIVPVHIFGGAIVVSKEGENISVIYSLVPRSACVDMAKTSFSHRKKLYVNSVDITDPKNMVDALARSCYDKNTIRVLIK